MLNANRAGLPAETIENSVVKMWRTGVSARSYFVILSGEAASLREAAAQSKDPYKRHISCCGNLEASNRNSLDVKATFCW